MDSAQMLLATIDDVGFAVSRTDRLFAVSRTLRRALDDPDPIMLPDPFARGKMLPYYQTGINDTSFIALREFAHLPAVVDRETMDKLLSPPVLRAMQLLEMDDCISHLGALLLSMPDLLLEKPARIHTLAIEHQWPDVARVVVRESTSRCFLVPLPQDDHTICRLAQYVQACISVASSVVYHRSLAISDLASSSASAMFEMAKADVARGRGDPQELRKALEDYTAQRMLDCKRIVDGIQGEIEVAMSEVCATVTAPLLYST